MFNFERCSDITGTFLQGHVTTRFTDLVRAFGEPDHVDYDENEKVSHQWDLLFTDAAGEAVRATIYDWKYYDGGIAVRSDVPIRWNIGGDEPRATWFIESTLRRGGK